MGGQGGGGKRRQGATADQLAARLETATSESACKRRIFEMSAIQRFRCCRVE